MTTPKSQIKAELRKLSEFMPARINPNAGNEHSVPLIVDSIQVNGAGRPMLADKDGEMIAGSHSLQAFIDAGYEEAVVISGDGRRPVIFIRDDIDIESPEGRSLQVGDNHIGMKSYAPDDELLGAILANLAADDAQWIKAAGYSEGELQALLKELDRRDYEAYDWEPEENYADSNGDGILELVGYSLSSFWKDLPRINEVYPYFMTLPEPTEDNKGSGTSVIKSRYSRTNATETERIVRTYMRSGDTFYEMCCGWMTFSSTAKYFGYSGKGSDIWDVSLDFCRDQIAAMPGDGMVEIVQADCRETGEPDNQYNFVHSNPPFFQLEKYSNSDNDLADLNTYEAWLVAMGDMGREAERILKPGGLANFVMNDFRDGKQLRPMAFDFMVSVLGTTDLILHDIVVAEVQSQAMRFRKRQQYPVRTTVKCHEYVITFRKR